MNEYGGLKAADELVKEAAKEMLIGHRKVFRNPEYRGTLLFHRLACYVTAIAEAKKLMKWPSCSDESPPPKDVERALDFVAYTNHVKCSPKDSRSEPTPEMWKNCGRHILSRELKLLMPEIILILGVDDNKTNFESLLDPQPQYGDRT